jgi:uncharacterized membrane protein YhaH (DUF805 family)
MENFKVRPQLGFGEALKLASGRLTDFKGRSRRSEFWWFMLVAIIANIIFGLILMAFPAASQIVSIIILLCCLGLTVRRLHDTGKSGIWVYVSFIAGIAYSMYFTFSGIANEMTSVNADPTTALKMLFNPVLGILGLINLVSSLCVIIFCILDGKPETNKYGESPKYYVE